MSAGAIAAAAAAAARRRREEEETMSGYSNADLNDGWEFKVLRSATGAFGKPERLQQALAEEARAGWVLLEKFDNDRVRLKRPVSAKAGDAGLGYDPYRTSYGMSQAMMAFLIVGIALGSVAALLLAVFIATR
ncbi:MAG: hypothetical protein U0574_10660 [Phycisphaerales bacterium]